MITKKDGKRANQHAACVRFNSVQRRIIEEDSINFGKSIPRLLRDKYFRGPRTTPLIAKPDFEELTKQLGVICHQLNFIQQRINGGIREGFADEFVNVQESFNSLFSFLLSRYCRCKLLRQKLQIN